MVSRTARWLPLLALALLCRGSLWADGDGAQWLDVEFPRDSPVVPVSFSLRPSNAHSNGQSTVLDIHASLLLRNTSSKTITGLTLRVEAQDLAPAGKASVTAPSLRVRQGEAFPMRLDLELRKPQVSGNAQGAVVRVTLDCALFKDFTSFGPDSLNSRRALIVYELQARRERQYVASLLDSGKTAEIREELNFGLQDLRPLALGLELSRSRPNASTTPSRQTRASLETMHFEGSPVRPLGGSVRIAGGDVSSPNIEIKNDSNRMVRSIEVGWIVRDEQGKEYFAGSTPVSLQLHPVESVTLSEPTTLHFFQPAGQAILVGSLTAFVSDVEFSDGDHWIPSRADIASATKKNVALRRALVDSPEQQRLAAIYRRSGIGGLAAELKRAD